MRRRGFFFTLDAILALTLIIISVASIIAVMGQTQNVYVTYSRTQDKYIATQTLTLLRTVPLREVVPQSQVEKWIKDSTLNLTLVSPDMSPIDIVSTYWSASYVYNNPSFQEKAREILGYILNRTLSGYNYELIVNGYVPATNSNESMLITNANNATPPDISPATLLISGYSRNQTPRGYMARAFLTKVSVEREDLFGWYRVLAAPLANDRYHSENTLILTRLINLPNDAKIEYADAKFVRRQSEEQELIINEDRYCTWAAYGTINKVITSCLNPGVNNFTTIYYNGRYYQDGIGSASGTTVYIKYRSNSTAVEDPGLVKMYQVDSRYTGFFYLLEMFVPGNITRIDMRFRVKGVHRVNLYYGLGGKLYLLTYKSPTNGIVEFTDDEIRQAVDQKLCGGSDCYDEFKANLSKMVFDFVVGFDAEFDSYYGRWRYGGGYCSYYGFNCHASDTEYGGVGRRILYGYPDSYVKITYTPRTLINRYSIPLAVYFPYGDPRVTYSGAGLQVSYYLPPKADPWYADWWVGYTFVDYKTIQNLYENGNRFYRGPLGRYAIRVAYTKIYPWMMRSGSTNRFEIRMTGGSSYVRNGESRGIIKYFIQGYAGYGDIFPYLLQGYPNYHGYNLTYYYWDGTSARRGQVLVGNPPYLAISVDSLKPDKYAVDDAILRLFNRLNFIDDQNPGSWKEKPFDGSQSNPIDVQLTGGLKIDFVSMKNIPSLEPPIAITLRVWRVKP